MHDTRRGPGALGAGLSRRRFLGLLVSGAAGLALAPRRARAAGELYDGGSPEIPGGALGEPERVIVVGAGMAGLAAANALAHAGVDVVVLEGRQRLGGRTHTLEVGAAAVDLGASWIHTPIGNPMTRLAEQVGVGFIPAALDDDLSLLSAFDDISGELSFREVVNAFFATVLFEGDVQRLRDELGSGLSLEPALQRFLDDFGFRGTQRRHAEAAIRFVNEQNFSGPLADVSLDEYELGIQYAGSDVFPSGGYRGLVTALAGGLDVRLGEEVEAIHCNARGVAVQVRVRGDHKLRKHAARRRTYRGSHVLLSVPLGVLKAQRIQISPRLPAAKRGAIAALGFGNFEKLVLRFDEPFWLGLRHHVFHLSAASGTLLEYPFFVDYTRFTDEPVLVGFGSAAFARSLSGMSRSAIRARALEVLGRLFPGGVPELREFHVTRWGRSRFTRGAYSYPALGSSAEDFDRLAAPVAGRLLFAGEATSRDRYGYADGALDTGVREAKRLLRVPAVQLGPLGAQLGIADAALAPLAWLERWRRRAS